MEKAQRDPPPDDRNGFRHRGGSSALDLTSTLQARLKPSPRELLLQPADLDRWLVSAGLASTPPSANEDDLGLARQLREAVFVLAQEIGAGGFGADALATLNRIAAAPSAVPLLRPDGAMELELSASRLLALIAREAVSLLGGENAYRIRQCQAPACTILYLDTSRSGDRRWCSMAACGNKTKVSEHRKRRRSAAATRSSDDQV